MNLRWLRRSITRESSKGWPKRVRYGSSHRRGISGDMTMVLTFLAADCLRVAADSRNGRAASKMHRVSGSAATAARPNKLITVQILARLFECSTALRPAIGPAWPAGQGSRDDSLPPHRGHLTAARRTGRRDRVCSTPAAPDESPSSTARAPARRNPYCTGTGRTSPPAWGPYIPSAPAPPAPIAVRPHESAAG